MTTDRPLLSTRAKLAILAGMMFVMIGLGIRHSFGIFLPPIGQDLGVGREAFGLAIALQMLLSGLMQPIFGIVADRKGAGVVLATGTVVYGLGLWIASQSQSPGDLQISLGVMVGIALAAMTYGPVLGAIGRMVPPQRRSQAFGLVTAGGSFGMFAMVPGGQALLDAFGWREAFVTLALVALCMIILVPPLAGDPRKMGANPGPEQSLSAALREAAGVRGYWLLIGSFFVCGAHVAFIGTHLPAFLGDSGLAPEHAATALALVGLGNVFGSYMFGYWGARYSKAKLLAILYISRSLIFIIFLALPKTPLVAILFGASMGFLWLGTVPLTNGIVVGIFGPRYLSTLGGIVFLSHQIGAFLGAWAAGLNYDSLGSYDLTWAVMVGLGVFAAAVSWPISEKPVQREGAAA